MEGLLYSNFERRVWRAKWIIRDVLTKFHLPNYVEESVSRLFVKAMKRGLTDGRSMERTAACFLYHVAKRDSLPLTAFEIADEMDFNKYSMLRTYSELRRKLGLANFSLDLKALVEKHGNELDLDPERIFRASKIVRKSNRENRNLDPRSKVALALYMASRKSQEEVSEVIGLSQETISRTKRRTEG